MHSSPSPQYFECGHAALLAPPSTTPELVDETEEMRTSRQLPDYDEFKGQKGTQKTKRRLIEKQFERVFAEMSRLGQPILPSSICIGER